MLLRNYTQNIDTLEREAGIEPELLVEAHGSFGGAHCIDCRREIDVELVKRCVFNEQLASCPSCNGLVKPSIVFFGENLPKRFNQMARVDFPKCDLLIVIGTSLSVHPFASLVTRVPRDVPRILINMLPAGEARSLPHSLGIADGLEFRFDETNYRDLFVTGDCQRSTMFLARALDMHSDVEQWLADGTAGIQRAWLTDIERSLNSSGSIISVGAATLTTTTTTMMMKEEENSIDIETNK